ncbi:LVIVD repeat-containing protein [Hyalangium gracile]|uniref:LVIVD repeat-containing protein n=1 Tax=Hyalangium gracile TaxID=394092 RepID=UPI001CCF95ED|nr:hypothetical protein [Hyalangium gracile]
MTKPFRFVLAMLILSSAWVGCDDDDEPSAPDGGVPDAGEEWDGSYVPLEELGDYIDPGRFAPCSSFVTTDAGAPVTCGSPESFDLSACSRSTLSQLSPDGIYEMYTRSESGSLSSMGFTISTTGGYEGMGIYPLVRKQIDTESFYVSGLRTLSDGGTQLYAYAGCSADSGQRYVGCYQTCINGGARRTTGTFEGVRLQRLSEPETSGITFVSEHRVEGLSTPLDVYVAKDHAYVVASTLGPAPANPVGGVAVFDVSDKAHPVLRKVLTVEGDTGWNAVWAKGDALYVGSGKHGVLVYDITHPADPQLVRGVPGDSFSVHTIYVDGNRMYAQAAGVNQVLIFDVSNPLDPVLLNRYTVPVDENGYGYPHDSFAYQSRLYINQMGQGYYVVDVTDAANPQPLGSYTYDTHIYNSTHANAVGTFAGRTIAFEGGENTNAHLRVLDVTDPARIVKIGEHRMRPQTSIHNMVLVGKRLYVAWYAEGLRVFDVSNPTRPREIAYANTFRDSDPGRKDGGLVGAIGIRVPGDGYVYVVDMTRGLLIYREP